MFISIVFIKNVRLLLKRCRVIYLKMYAFYSKDVHLFYIFVMTKIFYDPYQIIFMPV